MKKDNYEFTAIFQYAKDGINISFPDIFFNITHTHTYVF